MKRIVLLTIFALVASLNFNEVIAANIAQDKKMVVVIDAGHGGAKYPGAHYGGVYEKDVNLAIALKLGGLIEKSLPQVKVVYTRTSDKALASNLNDDLQARANIANKSNGELFISIHANAASARSASGVETLIMGESSRETATKENVLYYNNQDEMVDMSDERTAAIVRAYLQNLQFTYGQYSEAMARCIQSQYAKQGYRNRGVKRQLLKVLYATDMPGVLTEVGFLSNAEDYKRITSYSGQMEIARAIFNGLKDYISFLGGGAAPEYVEQESAVTKEPASDTVEYAIQIQASTKSMSQQRFKVKRSVDLELHEVVGSGTYCYKFCVGRFANADAAAKELAEVKKAYKDAFVVKIKDGRIEK